MRVVQTITYHSHGHTAVQVIVLYRHDECHDLFVGSNLQALTLEYPDRTVRLERAAQ